MSLFHPLEGSNPALKLHCFSRRSSDFVKWWQQSRLSSVQLGTRRVSKKVAAGKKKPRARGDGDPHLSADRRRRVSRLKLGRDCLGFLLVDAEPGEARFKSCNDCTNVTNRLDPRAACCTIAARILSEFEILNAAMTSVGG